MLLLIGGPAWRPTVFPLHKLSFIVWLVFTALHVLAHLPAVGSSLRADASRAAGRVAGRGGRLLALAGALLLGTALAVLVIPDFHVWGLAIAHHFGHHAGD